MEALLDEVLVMVLQYLDVPDLLACRLVSQRVGALVLHPCVWARRPFNPYDGEGRRRQWAGGDDDVGVLTQCVCPVLRLSPCLGALHVVLPPPRWCPAALYSSTGCAAARLRLVVNGSIVASKAAEFVRRQEALGRLRFVDLAAYKGTGAGVSALLCTVLSVPGLEGLALSLVFRPDPTVAVACSSSATAPHLKRFHCNLDPWTEDLVNAVLVAHAATLEGVHLIRYTCYDGGIMTFHPETLSLLAGAPNLSELTCDCHPGLGAVPHESLTVLHLSMHYKQAGCSTPSAVEEAAELLQRAEHLREVTLEYTFPHRPYADLFAGVDLVLALASSRPSRVEKLTIQNNNYVYGVEVPGEVQINVLVEGQVHVQVHPVLQWEPSPDLKPCPQLQQLISTLPSLPHLRHLQVGAVTTELLLALLCPDTVPALQRVELSLEDVECIHEWLHQGDMVKGLMSARPSLHLELQANYCTLKYCKVCLQSCHKELWDERTARALGFEPARLGLFAHDPAERCFVDHTADRRRWLRVPLVEVPCDANGRLFEVLDSVISSALLASSNLKQ
ncbi:uncharacterized protein LOC113217396 [Frankliniella occidentalis]|uniref:Uncharacterized protein LOC113217396 n=1 Tax=Frankliniella occidentalis TaxID=133901 RepID=A0A6J1TIG1_FRAOC|nr:uncharacterized protein LOC113217396 [Frankliniella occidentalis]